MSKGQNRSSRETRKPKQDKPKTAAAAASPFATPPKAPTPAPRGAGSKR